MQKTKDIAELKEIARQLRISDLKTIYKAGSGHPGGSLSMAEIITALYFYKMNHNPKEPHWNERDRLILSKGHACPILYCALAKCGYFAENELWKLRKMGSMLQGHPDRNKTPGIETCTGSLGQGINVAVGIALAGKLDSRKYKTYCIVGDGECQEGSVWEAIMAAPNLKLSNIVLIVDNNQVQQCGFVNDIMKVNPMTDKLKAFSWDVVEIDGNSMEEVVKALDKADKQTKPFAIVANTKKGKGVSFMELNPDFHGRAPNEDELKKALVELGEM